MPTEPQVSDEQKAQTKQDVERKRQAGKVPIAADQADTLVPHQYTERDPLTPQPEPDANPLVPNIERPSRSRSEENVDGPHRVSEVADASSTSVAPEAQHQARVEAGKKAAETRKANEEHQKRSAAAQKAAKTRARNERKK